METSTRSILNRISSPADLKGLEPDELVDLCSEIRGHFIDVVSRKGGHFAAGLGVVELTVALHYVFQTPHDQLIWDVGHQAYVHKMLTGRFSEFESIRRLNGLSGFPKRDESEYDTFGTGHASTSISAALGMAIADQIKGDYQKQHIAVIGDGALTGGMAFEGLNNAGVSSANLLIVLNDNSISIDPAVGALSHSLDEEAKSPQKAPGIGDGRNKGRRSKIAINGGLKAVNLGPKAFFESLGVEYHGPVNGHNIEELLPALAQMKSEKGPRILHVKTVKGKGYQPAEDDQVGWHAPGKFDKLTGQPIKPNYEANKPLKFQEVFGNTLVELAEKNDKIVGITPAMPSGSSMNIFMRAFPERAFDVGIAEEHAVTFAAGLATQGLTPFCSIYSTFLQRAYDQVIHDVCLQNLPVVFCIDRAGLVGQDGPTHHGVFDLAYLRCIPNIVVAAPKDEVELRNLMFTAQGTEQPFAIRYPRGTGSLPHWRQPFELVEIGKGEVLKEGENVAVLSIGTVSREVKAALDLLPSNMNPGLFNMRFVKPLDEELIRQIASSYNKIITIEDGSLNGGFGSAVLEFVSDEDLKIPVKRLGISDDFVPHGKPEELYKLCGLDAESIAESIKDYWA